LLLEEELEEVVFVLNEVIFAVLLVAALVVVASYEYAREDARSRW
jgi:hypothetical protein